MVIRAAPTASLTHFASVKNEKKKSVEVRSNSLGKLLPRNPTRHYVLLPRNPTRHSVPSPRNLWRAPPPRNTSDSRANRNLLSRTTGLQAAALGSPSAVGLPGSYSVFS